MNNPVMGGKLIGRFQKMIKGEDSTGKFAGHVAIVPFLQASGLARPKYQRKERNGQIYHRV